MKFKKTMLLMIIDFSLLLFSFYLAFILKYNTNNPFDIIKDFIPYIIGFCALKILIFYVFELYQILWKFAGIRELWRIIISTFVANAACVVIVLLSDTGMPKSVLLATFIIDTTFIGFSRMAEKSYIMLGDHKNYKNKSRGIIVGAGEAGNMILHEIRRNNNLKMIPVGFIDDDLSKKGKNINGIPILGNRHDIKNIVKKYEINQIIFAIPTAKVEDRTEILKIINETGIKTRIVPGLFELIDGKIDVNRLKEIQVEDLLGREIINLKNPEILPFIKDKVVLITGGGGSIGSELARQIAKHKPKKLILLDIYENEIYNIQMELKENYLNLDLNTIIASVRDKKMIDTIMDKYKPEILFHAAAHKHVPLMEENPSAAIINNVYGTLNVIKSANEYGVKKFVQISTDKAVNPTNVMGTTKRICEMMIQGYNQIYDTDYVALRFGNVLGSNGSVVPIFKKQIAKGGPITLTDKNIIRYFMTISEACQLVLIAGSMAKGGEIFVLDMGEPVKIYDLVKNLIRLSGKEVDKDIEIKIVGLRPGEKLYEELLIDKNTMEKTQNSKIFIEKPKVWDIEKIEKNLNELKEILDTNLIDDELIIEKLKEIVPSYKPNR